MVLYLYFCFTWTWCSQYSQWRSRKSDWLWYKWSWWLKVFAWISVGKHQKVTSCLWTWVILQPLIDQAWWRWSRWRQTAEHGDVLQMCNNRDYSDDSIGVVLYTGISTGWATSSLFSVDFFNQQKSRPASLRLPWGVWGGGAVSLREGELHCGSLSVTLRLHRQIN